MNDVAPQGAGLEEVLCPLRQLGPRRPCGRGTPAAPATRTPAAMTLEGLNLEFREVHALPAAKEAAAQPQLVPVR